jgi:hypothetical protein
MFPLSNRRRQRPGAFRGFATGACWDATPTFVLPRPRGGKKAIGQRTLVDYFELRVAQGVPLAEAVVDVGAVRFRPMLLTAAAVVVGDFVMLIDPIFQGLAISLMAGEVASTLLSRMAVPVLYYMAERRERGAEKSA